MVSASVDAVSADGDAAASIAAMSAKPPSRLAMSPDGSGSPSSAVTMPIVSMSPIGVMTTTRNCSGVRPNASGVSPPVLVPWYARSGDTGTP